MGVFSGTGRKNTGRTDKYSDEDPLTDYKQYRKDYPKDNARKQAEDISNKKVNPHFIGKKSIEVRRQELISHIQNFPEFFENSVKQNIYFDTLDRLTQALK